MHEMLHNGCSKFKYSCLKQSRILYNKSDNILLNNVVWFAERASYLLQSCLCSLAAAVYRKYFQIINFNKAVYYGARIDIQKSLF